MAEMFALKTIEYVAKYLPRAVKDGNDKEARAYMALANTFAGYYMMCTSAHTMEHVMGSFHDNLIHGAGLIEIAHAYYDFFAEKKASEENMIKMAGCNGCCPILQVEKILLQLLINLFLRSDAAILR